jgi:hypothetical protein
MNFCLDLYLVFLSLASLALIVRWVHLWRCPSCRIARRKFREWYPDRRVSLVQHRATESDRDVIAVSYRLRERGIAADPYVLIEVSRDGVAREMPSEVFSCGHEHPRPITEASE